MLMDTQEIFSNAQAVTATGDTASTNVYDTGVAADDGIGEPLMLVVNSVAAATSGGSATVQAVLQTSVDNATWTDAMAGPAVAYTVASGSKNLWKARLPYGLNRYLRVAYRIGTAVLTGGTFSAFLVKDTNGHQYPASGFTVDV